MPMIKIISGLISEYWKDQTLAMDQFKVGTLHQLQVAITGVVKSVLLVIVIYIYTIVIPQKELIIGQTTSNIKIGVMPE